MANPRPRLEKPTLDEYLDKVTLAEQATQHVLKPWAGVGLGLLFLIVSMIFAACYAANIGIPQLA